MSADVRTGCRSADPDSHVAIDARIPAPAAVAVISVEPAAPETDAAKTVAKVSAAEVSAGDVGVSAAPTAAAATEAGMSTMSTVSTVAAAMAAAMSTSTPMAAATSAGGRKRWGKGDCSAEGCGSGDSDHGLSRHGGVILSGYPSTMRDVRSVI
jgi:hypothetical protein